jgi:hypothetical protein
MPAQWRGTQRRLVRGPRSKVLLVQRRQSLSIPHHAGQSAKFDCQICIWDSGSAAVAEFLVGRPLHALRTVMKAENTSIEMQAGVIRAGVISLLVFALCYLWMTGISDMPRAWLFIVSFAVCFVLMVQSILELLVLGFGVYRGVFREGHRAVSRSRSPSFLACLQRGLTMRYSERRHRASDRGLQITMLFRRDCNRRAAWLPKSACH